MKPDGNLKARYRRDFLPKVLITRPQQDSERLAPLVRARGYEPVINPLLQVAPLDAILPPGDFSHLVFTSATAIAFVPDSVARTLPVYCVGAQTAAAARRAGFSHIMGVASNVLALVEILNTLPEETALLYPSAREPAHDLTALLGPHGIMVKRWPVYETNFLPLGPEAIHLLSHGEVQWILLFSERTAKALKHTLPLNHRDWSGKIGIAAISEAAMAPVKTLGWARMTCAREPTAAGVLDCL